MIRRFAAVTLAVLLLGMQGEQAAGVVPCPLHQAAHAGDGGSGIGHGEHQDSPDHAPSCSCVGACQVPATVAPVQPAATIALTPETGHLEPQFRYDDPKPSFSHLVPFSTAPPATC